MDRDFLEEASLGEGTMKPLREKDPEEASGRVIALYSFMRRSVRCCHKKRHRRGSGKQNILYSQVLEKLGMAHYTVSHGEAPAMVKRQKGREREHGPEPLLGFSLERQGRAR